ncbi:MAG: hypothetical protein IJ833_03300 [Lachnospiraceae bacterium]|nr:hypothetical protein [Lachnospiraceae bacterium]
MWSEVSGLFRDYMGSGLVVLWFLLSVCYLFVREKRKHIRILFVYVPLLLLAIFFNPFVAGKVYAQVGLEVYYRILWLIPFTVVIAFTVVEIYGKLRGRKRKAFLAVAAGILMVSGSLIYSSPLFRVAENMYHVPQSVVEICDAIEVEGREVRAVFPAELIQYVRQYSPLVCMPYGREILVKRWGNRDELYDLMEAEEIDAQALANAARARECHYIVLAEEQKIKGALQDQDYELFDAMQGYVVYKDATVTLEYR